MTATATKAATSKFRLLRGSHLQKEERDGVVEMVKYTAKDPTANIVESSQDLEMLFGSEKFQSLERIIGGSEDTSALQRRIAELEAENAKLKGQPAPEDDEYELSKMTAKELRKYAEEMDIDLGTASSKEELINTIRVALDTQ